MGKCGEPHEEQGCEDLNAFLTDTQTGDARNYDPSNYSEDFYSRDEASELGLALHTAKDSSVSGDTGTA